MLFNIVVVLQLVTVVSMQMMHVTMCSQQNFSTAVPNQVLGGYADGYNPAAPPFSNTLEAAQTWCCAQGSSHCGGITHQAGLFQARLGSDPRQCDKGCDNITSWPLIGTHSHGIPPPFVPVWPVPLSVILTPGPPKVARVQTTFKFELPTATNLPPMLSMAANRYQTIIEKAAKSNNQQQARGFEDRAPSSWLGNATVSVVDISNIMLTLETDYSYTLTVSVPTEGAGNPTAAISANTVFGAMYGMETLAQLCANGTISPVSIQDRPLYRWRGLMIDTGRRFVPVPDVLDSLDAMSYTKMNVLHLHLSDDQRCAVDSVTYPNLTAGLTGDMGGSYSSSDINKITTYANDRGIMVVPEVDMPGHANGLLPLKGYGANFCSDSQMYEDANGDTSKVLIGLVKEYAALFKSQIFHLGCDETTVVPPLCTLDATKAVEVAVSEAVHAMQHEGGDMWPMGWEEFHYRTNASNSVGPGLNGTIIEAWSKVRAADVVKLGYRAVEAYGAKFYLNHLHPTNSQWQDIGANIVGEKEAALMLGGDIAMWTLEYRAGACSADDKHGCGVNQFAPSTDAMFSKSFGGIVWPRASVGGAAFWNYNASWAFEDLQQRYFGFASVLEARGVNSCPAACTRSAGATGQGCDYGYACDKPYM
eukprot:m.209908 g.209908  ORF g.209908 m.209908 type:complete len:646 (+) comp33056_c0_seq1:89-2026(+)